MPDTTMPTKTLEGIIDDLTCAYAAAHDHADVVGHIIDCMRSIGQAPPDTLRVLCTTLFDLDTHLDRVDSHIDDLREFSRSLDRPTSA